MLKGVIVEDERLVANFLKMQLEQSNLVSVVGEFLKPSDALKEIPTIKPDVVFLDIEMPGMNGIELGTKLLNQYPEVEIVFVTAYNQYAVEAFKLNALHYILKPSDEEEVREAIQRVLRKKNLLKLNSDNSLKIELLGHIKVFQNNEEVRLRWTTVKVEELFSLMVLYRKTGIEKWQIIEKLWPNIEMKKAEQNLYTTIYRLKKTFLESGIQLTIENIKGKYTIELSNCTIDIEEQEDWHMEQLFGDRSYEWKQVIKL
ncbi:response regulator receiver domain-containing protein [Ureibacillus xyleni]|uniref:Response regulator receiver domain-containing protein n=1 Tax=Ureibacillus xyleni TaxID=614648 RepID=A0A285RJ70_9BACL|nr:response regulator [Ureibacillus xyleni]SOB94141.1 response regulator receiver domain-containing protein [Ureibacillus xyleni]